MIKTALHTIFLLKRMGFEEVLKIPAKAKCYLFACCINMLCCGMFGARAVAQIPGFFLSNDFDPPKSWTQTDAAAMSVVTSTTSSTYLFNSMARNPTGAGKPKGFRFYSAVSGGTIYGPASADVPVTLNTVTTLNTTGNNTNAYTVTALNATNRILFKTDATARLLVFEIQGAVASINAVARNPAGTISSGQAVVISATLGATLPVGQYVYLRYTANGNFGTSTILPMTLVGGTYQATIPAGANTAGTTVSYYVFTSGLNTSPSNSDADLATINLDNNAGVNYSYTVAAAAGWTTAAPGNWSNPATWTANAVPPTSGNLGAVNIGHNVTLDQNATATSLNITAGTLTTQAANTLNITGATTISSGATLNNSSTVATNYATSSLELSNGGTYIHNAAGSSTNGAATDFPGTTRTFGASSNVIIQKWANGGNTPAALPASGSPGWGNLTINVTSLGGIWRQYGNLTNMQGNLNILKTAGREFRLAEVQTGSVNNLPSITIQGDVLVDGGVLAVLGGSTSGSGSTLRVYLKGDLTINSGTLYLTGTNGFTNYFFIFVNYCYIYLEGDLEIRSPGKMTQTKASSVVSGLDFVKASGEQHYYGYNGAIDSAYTGFWVGDGTTTNTLVLHDNWKDSKTLTVLPSQFRIWDKATLNTNGEFFVGGVASFQLDAGGTLKMGSVNGITSPGNASGNVQTTAGRGYSTAAHYVYNGVSNQVTGDGLPTAITGSLTIDNAGVNPTDIVSLTTDNTSTVQFNLAAGRFQAGLGKTLRVSSAGIVNGNGYTSYTGNQYIDDDAGGTIEFIGSGTVNGAPELYNVTTNGAVNFVNNARINHQFMINTGGSVNTNAPKYAVGSTLIYNTGGSFSRGKEWDQLTALDRGYPHHVLVQKSTILNLGTTVPTRLAIGGNLSIGTASSSTNIVTMNNLTIPLEVNGNLIIGNLASTANELRLSTVAGGNFHLYGNFTRYTSSNIYTDNSRTIYFKGTGNSTINTPGVTNQSFSNAVADKSNGTETITLNTAVSITQNISFNKGIVNTDLTNLLTVTNTATGSVTGGSILSFVNGPMRRFTSTTTAGAYAYPLGKTGTPGRYKPITLTTVNNLASGSDFTGQYFYADPPIAGSDAFLTNLVGIQKNEYWQLDRNAGSTTGKITLPYVNPGVGFWRDAAGTSNYPCATCNVGVVKRNATTGSSTWDFTAATTTLSSAGSPPELMAYTNSGDVISREVSSFSPFTLGFYYDVILPVKLVSFTGKLMGTDALLQWEIANGQDVRHMALERSSDGSSFLPLAKFERASNDRYSFTDVDLRTGMHFYRLAITDPSGELTYSQVILLSVGNNQTRIIGLQQNPVANHLTLRVVSATIQPLSLTITDVQGRKLTANRYQLTGGLNSLSLHLDPLKPGIYFLSATTGDRVSATIKFVKQ